MNTEPPAPTRRRLPKFDYAAFGAYFVTICTHQRQMLFEEPDVQDIIVRCWLAIPDHFPSVETDSFVVMPNHVHGILNIVEQGDRARAVGALHAAHLRPAFVPTIVQSFKSAVTKQLHLDGLIQPNDHVWQRSFYDRVIRNEPELHRIREYIANNPAQWGYDHDNPDHAANTTYIADWGWLEGGKA